MAELLTEQRVERLESEVGKIRADLVGVQVSLANQDRHREELKGLVAAGFAEIKALIRDRSMDEQRRAERVTDAIHARLDRHENEIDQIRWNQAGMLARIGLPAGIGAAVSAMAAAALQFWRGP